MKLIHIIRTNKYINLITENNHNLARFIRFSIIGVFNTVHYYFWYLILLNLRVNYVTSHTIAFVLSMIGSYFLNCFYAFKTKPTLMKFIKYPLTALSNYLISTFSLIFLVSYLSVNRITAAFFAAILPIPATFIVTHYVLLKTEKESRKKGSTAKLFFNFIRAVLIIAALGVFAAGCFLSIIKSGKLFAPTGSDSIHQLLYFVPFLQKAFLIGHPFWSWSYGLGGDIFGEFCYYYTTSPFFYLLLLMRKLGFGHWAFADYLQWKLILSIFKDFLAMLCMYALLKYERHKNYLALIGAVVYGGAVWFSFYSYYFDFMTDAYVWVPLAILGLRIYLQSRWWLFYVITAAVTVINSFYFGYISLIYYGIYALIFLWPSGQPLRVYLNSIGRFLLLTFTSIALAGFSIFPAVLAFFHTDRFLTQIKVPPLYNLNFYNDLPMKIFSYSDKLGVPLLLLLILSMKWSKLSCITKKKTILAFILTVFLLTPYAGSMFNGFSYSSSRWYYLFVFTMAYALPNWIEESSRLRRRDLYLSLTATGLTAIYFYHKFSQFTDIIVSRQITCLLDILWLSLSVLPIVLIYFKHCFCGQAIRSLLNYLMVICIAAAALINSNICLYLQRPYVTKTYLQNSGLENSEEQQLFKQLTPANNQFYRTVFRDLSYENAPMSYEYYGSSAYNSLLNGNLHKWLTVDYDILNPHVSPSRYKNFDDRLFLETVFGVRYIVVKQTENFNIPYCYKLHSQTKNYKIYESQQNVSFDLWYSTYTDLPTYNKMNTAEKDAMLLQTAVLDSPIAGMSTTKLDQTTSELSLNWSSAATHNIELKDGRLTAGHEATLQVPISRQKNNTGSGEIIFSMHLVPINGQAVKLSVNGKSTIKMDAAYPYTYPNDQYTFCLNNSTTSLNIGISEGQYIFSDAKAWFNSYSHYAVWVNQRNKYNLEDLSINGGNVTGTIRNQEKGILVLNIPFNRGWTAKADGKRQELLKINGLFTGLVLNPGVHKVKLTFVTPGLIPGVLLSLIVFVSIIGIILVNELIMRWFRRLNSNTS